MPVNEFIKENLGFDHDFLVPVVFAHVGWVFLFFFVFAYGIKFLNFQRRWNFNPLVRTESVEYYS